MHTIELLSKPRFNNSNNDTKKIGDKYYNIMHSLEKNVISVHYVVIIVTQKLFIQLFNNNNNR